MEKKIEGRMVEDVTYMTEVDAIRKARGMFWVGFVVGLAK